MNDQNKERKSYSIGIVLVWVLLMIAFIIVQLKVFGLLDKKEASEFKKAHEESWGDIPNIKAASSMYEILKTNYKIPHFIDPEAKKRTLRTFYSRRALLGAPPTIPHPIANDPSLTGETCLGCHKHGGYNPNFRTYAPVVPHPEKLNCRQCHNPEQENGHFKKSNWPNVKIVKIGRSYLPGSPPVIPHSLQMRENCLSCHSGPSAVVEIRTTHPERVSCLQCHVEDRSIEKFVRRKIK